MPILAQPPEITDTDKAVLRNPLGSPDRQPRGADAMRAAVRDLAQRREVCGKRASANHHYDDLGRAMGEHFDRFCRFPG